MTELELYFKFRCQKGLKKRGLAEQKEYQDRLEYEIKTITQMGYCGYFLIVSDIITWALKNDIPVGPGRGSAAGSLVAYVLEITHLDPIQYGLIFERFLNPDRISMPDIDMDFCELNRAEVIQYVEGKYGYDRVAHIGTYGSMKAKASIRDVTRTLGLPYTLGDKLAKLTLEPVAGKPQPLSTSYDKVDVLKRIRFGEESDGKTILTWAEKMENRLRSYGTHASGVVISNQPISQIVPLYPGKGGLPTTQFDMNIVEEKGLIKFDFLGLRALTTIKRCTNMIKERHGVDIDPLQIPVDDAETYKMLQSGDTTGVFQLEGSAGMRDLLVQIRPQKLEDIAILVAIYRPGPLGSDSLSHYLKVRTGNADPIYLFPELESILSETDGMLIYQEQIIRMCKELAGYSAGEADDMRKAVGKKKQKLMNKHEKKFQSGMVKNGFKLHDAKKLWEDIVNFAQYGFNKAHAACYGYIAYQMAYLKTHYPLEFITSCLISDSNEVDKVIQYIAYCKDQDIEILGPSVNHSQYEFSIDDDNHAIRFGLGAVKNLGQPVTSIIQERIDNGLFKNILEFAERVDLSKINKRKMESLVLSGAFDSLSDNNRASLLGAVDSIQEYKAKKKAYDSKLETYSKRIIAYDARQIEIAHWDMLPLKERKKLRAEGKKKPGRVKFPQPPEEIEKPEIPQLDPLPEQDVLMWEKELLGFYISGHPLDYVTEKSDYTIAEIKQLTKEHSINDSIMVRIIAIPSLINIITTKQSKRKMAYMVLEDKTGTIQSTVMPDMFSKFEPFLNTQTPALYNVKLEIIETDLECIAKLMVISITALPSVLLQQSTPLDLKVTVEKAISAAKKLKEIQGTKHPVNFMVKSNGGNWSMGNIKTNKDRNALIKSIKEIK